MYVSLQMCRDVKKSEKKRCVRDMKEKVVWKAHGKKEENCML